MCSELDKLYDMFDQLNEDQLSPNSTQYLIFTIAKSLNLVNELGDKLKGHRNFELYKCALYDYFTYQMEDDLGRYIYSDKCKDLNLTTSFSMYSPVGQSFIKSNYKINKG